MNNSLQFKHFRKFENFPEIKFNDITFIVGKNNSGKSTFVKAFVMVYNYLKSGNLKQLDLNQGSVELLNIVTFDRALCKTMNNREQKEYIPISLKLGNYEFFLEVTGKKNSTILDVKRFKVVDSSTFFTLNIDPQGNYAVISYRYTEKNVNDVLSNVIYQKVELEKILETITDELSKESISLKNRIEKLSNTIKSLNEGKSIVETTFHIDEDYEAENFTELFKDLSSRLLTKYRIENPNINLIEEDKEIVSPDGDIEDIKDDIFEEQTSEEEEVFDDLQYYYYNRHKFEDFYNQFLSFSNTSRIFYLPATLNKQSALLSIRDKNNDLADVVHKYYQLKLHNHGIISSFVKHWINEFQIGTDIKIELINSEAYDIALMENDVWIPLADKGMGSIQAVLLILRLASVIYFQQQENKKLAFNYFVIVEEPELNLHPALQSKLCDLFFEVYDKYKVKFIIETHSEYIIRKTQLLVKSKELEVAPNENPFAVLYFNDDLNVWNMEYRVDGKFKNDFGTGFFDETRNLVKQML